MRLLLASLAVLLFLTAPAAAETKLRVTVQLPIMSHFGQNLLRFKELVEAASGGDMVVEIYPSAQLFTDKEVPVAVASGQIEMGSASLARFAGTIPAVDIFNVPFLLNSHELMRRATAPGSAVRGPIDQAMIDKGARPLWWQPYGLMVLFMRDKMVRRPEDLKGLKIRTPGKAFEAFVNLLGGAATNISGSRQYLAYERGTVDGGTTGLIGVRERKLYQVLDKLILTNQSGLEFVVIINERFWQKLDDAQRAILTQAARTAEAELRDDIVAQEAEAYEIALANGMDIYELTEDDLAAWRAATLPLEDTYVEAAGPLGAQLLEAAKEIRAAVSD